MPKPSKEQNVQTEVGEYWNPTETNEQKVEQPRLKCGEGACQGKLFGLDCKTLKFSCFKTAPEHAVFFDDFAVYVSPKPPNNWVVEIYYENRKNLLVAKSTTDILFNDLKISKKFANFQSKIKEIYGVDAAKKTEELIKELQGKFKNPKANAQFTTTKVELKEDLELQNKAMELLQNPDMMTIILNEYNRYCYGERDLLEFLHYICTARYVRGQWVHISGLSRGGKDTTARIVFERFPKEDVMTALRFSEHGLEYSGKEDVVDLDGKIIYVSEAKGLKAALDILRPLFGQKGKSFTTYTVDSSKGVKGRQLKLIGCPVLINTSVIPDMSEQTTKRFWLVNIDESEAQTKGVQELEKYKRSHPSEYNHVSETMKVIEKALALYPKNTSVFIPYAQSIKFPTDKVRYRGDLDKFLDFVESIAYTYMFQRSWIKTGDKTIVIANLEDFNTAKRILGKFFAPTLMDLPSFIGEFYKAIEVALKKAEMEGGLTVKEIVRLTNKSDETVRSYMNELKKAGLIISEKRAGINHYYLSFEPLDVQTINNITLDYDAKEINKRILEEMKVYLENGAEIIYRQMLPNKQPREFYVTKELVEKTLSRYD